MRTESPRVSVIMPVYNAEAHLRAAVESVLRQTFSDFELLLLNDGSTDRSAEILDALTDPRIRVFHSSSNRGAAATKNQGIDEARGDLIAFLDSDDVAYPNRLAEQVRWLELHPEIGIVGGGMIMIDEKSRPTGAASFPASWIPERLLFANILPQSTILLRRSLLTGERFRTDREPAEDYDLWGRLCLKTATLNLADPLIFYRIHSGGISARKPERMRIGTREIHRDQIARLGLTPGKDDLALHGLLTQWPVDASCELLLRAERWLMTLQAANRQTGLYPPADFEAVLGTYWTTIALASWRLGIRGWNRFRKSPLSSLASPSLRQYAEFTLRAILASLRSRLLLK